MDDRRAITKPTHRHSGRKYSLCASFELRYPPLLVAVSDTCRGGWLNAEVSCPSACGPAWLAPNGVLVLSEDVGVLANGVDQGSRAQQDPVFVSALQIAPINPASVRSIGPIPALSGRKA